MQASARDPGSTSCEPGQGNDFSDRQYHFRNGMLHPSTPPSLAFYRGPSWPGWVLPALKSGFKEAMAFSLPDAIHDARHRPSLRQPRSRGTISMRNGPFESPGRKESPATRESTRPYRTILFRSDNQVPGVGSVESQDDTDRHTRLWGCSRSAIMDGKVSDFSSQVNRKTPPRPPHPHHPGQAIARKRFTPHNQSTKAADEHDMKYLFSILIC